MHEVLDHVLHRTALDVQLCQHFSRVSAGANVRLLSRREFGVGVLRLGHDSRLSDGFRFWVPLCSYRIKIIGGRGSAAVPHRETENMRDGSDAIADWPLLNALLNCASGADLVAIHGIGSRGVSAGVTVIADGNAATAERLQRVLDGDPGIGVLRHADAGYEEAVAAARARDVRIPMLGR